ncbi:MAG: ribose-5-phosphate isomerase RpiA [Planctomycetes bacterium]|nr:ribose-5-phosphate isomerase RpiA [Planctomycetota bacterium]
MHNPKEVAGRRAAEFVESGMRVGLGTGSTVHFTLLRLAERMAEGLKIVGVPTSIDTQNKARALGIPLADLESVEALDLTIDGADEIDGRFDMIKGGGGALLREKVVASITRRQIAIVGADKVVARLGAFPLPVEVVPFALAVIRRALERKGAGVVPRLGKDGNPYVTDNGNRILDCRFPGGIGDPGALEAELDRLPGIVETGLFVGLAHTLVIGHEDGRAEVRHRS